MDPIRLVTGQLNRIPAVWRHVLGIYLAVKITLTVTGLVARHAFDAFLKGVPADGVRTGGEAAKQVISAHESINMWFAWDSLLYQRIAWSSPGHDWDLQFGFPPLYPLLTRIVAIPLGGDTPLAMLVISNACLILALYFGYQLVRQLTGDESTAQRFIRYLVLLPAGFLFQAAMTESLFLCLLLAACYAAERKRWWLAGGIGFALALSRSLGFVMVIPLALILLRQHGYRRDKAALLGYLRSGLPLLLVPAGWASFMLYCKWQTGDLYRYKHVQETGYSIITQNPLRTIWDGLTLTDQADVVRMWFAVAFLALTVLGLRYLRFEYVVCALLLILVPLSMGPQVYRSVIRYLVVVFPVAQVLAVWGRRRHVDLVLTAGMAVLQGALWLAWLAYWTGFIV